MELRTAALAQQGLLQTTTVRTWSKALRSKETWLYRLTEKGRHQAPLLEGEARRVLTAVHQSRLLDADGWAPEDEIRAVAFPAARHPYHARYRLKQWLSAGLLERRPTRPAQHLSMLTLAPAGLEALRAEAARQQRPAPQPTRVPRLDQCVHHLMAVTAALDLVADAGGRLVRFLGDEDLRSTTRRGRQMAAGSGDVHLPDGRVSYRVGEGQQAETADLEILVSKYTDAQIRAKYEHLAPQGCHFFAPTGSLCDRVTALGLPRPRLLA